MTGKIETHPKQMVKNADKQKSATWATSFVCILMKANSPPNHPGRKMSQTRHSINPNEISVSAPKITHRTKEMMPV